jgi:hypothetical protein
MSWLKTLFGKRPPKPSLSQEANYTDPFSIPPSDKLKALSRPAWIPDTNGQARPSGSKIGGRPWMGQNEPWPNCSACQNPLDFILQLDRDDLPSDAGDFGSGLLRFFYCNHEACAGLGGWEAFDPQHHLDVLYGDGALREIPNGVREIGGFEMTGWREIEDYPHWEDRPRDLIREDACGYGDEKLLGWPIWYQGPDWVKCPKCQTQMTVLFQIWEPDGANFAGGKGHIHQCPDHPDSLAFNWACG